LIWRFLGRNGVSGILRFSPKFVFEGEFMSIFMFIVHAGLDTYRLHDMDPIRTSWYLL